MGASSLLYVVVPLISAVVGAFLGSYFRKKGENVATKQDVAAITKLVETVKADFAQDRDARTHDLSVLLESSKANQLRRSLTVPERLAALQQAFVHWRKNVEQLPHPRARAGYRRSQLMVGS